MSNIRLLEKGENTTRSMKIDSGKISKELQELARLSIKSVFYKWKSINTRQVSEFTELINNLKEKYTGLTDSNGSGEELWDTFSNTLSDIKKWMSNLYIIPEPEETTELIIDWNQQFKSYVAPYPEEIKITYAPDFWITKSSDSITDRGYKWLYRKIKLLLPGSSAEDKQKKQRLRKIELHEFLKHFFELPIDKFIEQEKQIYLKTVSAQIKKIHKQLAQAKSAILSKEEPLRKSAPTYNTFKQNCLSAVSKLHSQISNMNGWSEYENHLDDRFSEFWQETQREYKTAWDAAGTFQLPSEKFGLSRNKKLRKEFESKRLKSKQEWYDYFDAVLQNLQKDIEISLSQLNIAASCLRVIGNIKKGISEKIRPNFSTIINQIDKSAAKIGAVSSNNGYKDMFLEERESFQGRIRETELPQLIDALVSTQIDRQLSSFNQTIARSTDVIAEKHRLLNYENGGSSSAPPKSRSTLVDTRNIVNNAIAAEIWEKNNQFSKSVSSELEKLMRAISDVDHVLHFHFEEAVRLLSQNKNGKLNEEASVTTLDGMKLAKDQLNRLQDESVQLEKLSENELIINTRMLLQRLQNITDNEHLFNLKLHNKEPKKTISIKNSAKDKEININSLLPETGKYIATLSGRAQKLSKQILEQPSTGIDKEAIDNSMSFLAGMQRRIEQVPFVYQRLFNLNPLQENRFFTGRKDELRLLKNKYQEWQSKNRTVVAVLNEPGSGLSSFFNVAAQNIGFKENRVNLFFEKHIESEDRLYHIIADAFRISDAKDIDSLKRQLLSRKDNTVCTVKGLEKLFLRKVNGMQIIRKFLNIVLETSERIFWVVGCNLHTWNYLKQAHKLDRCIATQITLNPFSREDINTILINRHRLSGFKLFFLEGSGLKSLPGLEKIHEESEKQIILQQIFFDQLTELANGNPTISILFWLASIQSLEDGKVYLLVDRYEPEQILKLLDRQNRLILHTIQEHRELAYHNICDMMMLPDHICRKCLSGSWMKGILVEEDQHYSVHPFLQNVIH